jgi:hypothetical protein
VVAAAVELADALCRLAALKKLEYVDELMDEIAGKRPPVTTRERSIRCPAQPDAWRALPEKSRRSTPSSRRRLRPRPAPSVLRRSTASRAQPAASFIRRHRAQVRQLVAQWTGENQLTLDAVLDDMISRCRELDLRPPVRTQALVNFTILLTAKTMHALFGPSRRKWIAL